MDYKSIEGAIDLVVIFRLRLLLVFVVIFRLGKQTNIALVGHLEQNQLTKWKVRICITFR